MFNNLIESTSHAKEFKRRGSFLLFTTATYVVLFVVIGVVSIYAYDARLEEQSLEVVTLLPPVDMVPTIDVAPAAHPERPRDTNNTNTVPERAVAMLSVNHPESVPPTVGTTPNKNMVLPEHGTVAITGRDREGGTISGPGPLTGRVVQPPAIVTLVDQPPPPPDPPKQPKIVSKGVITGLAVSLPKPLYSEIAKKMRIQGMVSVQVLVDETGRVVSAKALGGSPFLVPEAQKAALQARFSPTILNDQPVKVSGVITYNFVLSN
jgi:protein TonB